MDKSKVEAILSWLTPRSATEVRSFHGLAQFYRKFVSRFSDICAPMNDTIKGGMKTKFTWTKVLDESFEKPFVVECDSSNIVVGEVFSQEGRPMAFFK